MPLICSDILADAFELAWDIWTLDMRAAPYDLSEPDEGWTPVKIETADGKREFAEFQRQFSERAAPIRGILIAECERLIAV